MGVCVCVFGCRRLCGCVVVGVTIIVIIIQIRKIKKSQKNYNYNSNCALFATYFFHFIVKVVAFCLSFSLLVLTENKN